jgi:hypothetical protein
LPDPFLRRCVTHHIELTLDTVLAILKGRLASFGAQEPLLGSAATFWKSLGSRALTRKPTIAEFWQWLALETRYGSKDQALLQSALTAGGDQLKALKFIATLFAPSDLDRISGKS